MLNTVGVLRKKKYSIDDTSVELKTRKLKTIAYYDGSLLFDAKEVSSNEYKTDYESSDVFVVEQDCLKVYQELVAKGFNPVLLNMANATSPGGGYRKGDAAQEENIFRRSDYYQSLDIEASDKDYSEYFKYDSTGRMKFKTRAEDLYPINQFGAIYTSGITVFRHSEDQGYAYMNVPMYDVCAIAMPAYRRPKLESNNRLENVYAINTLKKIENIFAIAYHQKHDCLVLSALGCGAFMNPPDHMALLFKSIIQQYAGYFKCIYFAIINDHNAKGKINPRGNFAPFEEALHKKKFYPPKSLRVNMMVGPYRILGSTPGKVLKMERYSISELPPCKHGSLCREIGNPDHVNSYSHRPYCGLQQKQKACPHIDDEVHKFTYFHLVQCKFGGKCTNDDPDHFTEFDHPDFCKAGTNCRRVDEEHICKYRHLPLCQQGNDCPLIINGDEKHQESFRHIKLVCPKDNCCTQFFDQKHLDSLDHSFNNVCPFTPYSCERHNLYLLRKGTAAISKDIAEHCLRFTHVCPFGRQCVDIRDKHHLKSNIHVGRIMCRDDTKCLRMSSGDHLESFSHTGHRDIRYLCKTPDTSCIESEELDHIKEYRHSKNLDRIGVVPSVNTDRIVSFMKNQQMIMDTVQNFIENAGWTNKHASQDLIQWVSALQPVHRCRSFIFESILEFGHVMSLEYMHRLNRTHNVSAAVMNHPDIRAILVKHQNPVVKQQVYEWIKKLVRIEFVKDETGKLADTEDNLCKDAKICENALKLSISDDIEKIRDRTNRIIQSALKLKKDPKGIGYHVDAELGTNKYVFSIVGPHHDTTYGDVVIVFNQEIMHHPYSYLTPQAGTSFYSSRTYVWRPWVQDPATTEKRIEAFHNSRMSFAIPGFPHVAAAELAAVTGLNNKSMDVTIDQALGRWSLVESHEVFEGHLPSLIPLTYIEKVYIPKNMFAALSKVTQETAQNIFQDSLVLTEHDVELDSEKPGNTIQLDPSRKPYVEYIVKELAESINTRMKFSNKLQGFTMTIAASDFKEHMLIPLTIADSYQHYRNSQPAGSTSPKMTYIYWEVMNGDVMLTLAHKVMNIEEVQADLMCLVCYVATKPATNTIDYHEEYSYLTDGHPLNHNARKHGNQFKAKSNKFFRGCNCDGFFKFCLKIDHEKNEAILSHVGSNGIYNRERISYEFNKKVLNLSRTNYIYVSAGRFDVPIRKLRITHEPIEELQIECDQHFMIDTQFMYDNPAESEDSETEDESTSDCAIPEISETDSSSQTCSDISLPKGEITKSGSDPCTNTYTISDNRSNSISDSTSDDGNKSNVDTTPDSLSKSSKKRLIITKFFRRLLSRPRATSKTKSNRKSIKNNSKSRDSSESSGSNDTLRDCSDMSESETYKPSRLITKIKRERPLHTPSLKLEPCPNSIYCLEQSSPKHVEKFSHPCRFNELCASKKCKLRFVHDVHSVAMCTADSACKSLDNPLHRAQYRHVGYPDFLIPCKFKAVCYEKHKDHKIKYFHGEEIPGFEKRKFEAIKTDHTPSYSSST